MRDLSFSKRYRRTSRSSTTDADCVSKHDHHVYITVRPSSRMFVSFFLLTPMIVAGVKRSPRLSVCLCMCQSVRTITQKRMITKFLNYWYRNQLGISYQWYDLGLKGQKLRSQGNKLQNILKAIE